ncbi:MAG: hypothetical protein LBJ11_01745 [Oscillospiraceae bacterium]|jgi:uncharacterized protein YxjI|nr:hypothetical protein [Oscillospiraceae bacterium]
MKLYIQQKVFSWRDQFAVKDEYGYDQFFARGEIFTWGRKLHIYNAAGAEVAFLHRQLFRLLSRYTIEIGGYSYEMVKEFTLLKPRFRIENLPWRMEGDFFAHEYDLLEGNRLVMHISKHWFTWGDSYELDIPNPGDQLMALCVALTVDCMMADAASSSS